MTLAASKTKPKNTARKREKPVAAGKAPTIDRATELSDQVLGHLATGQRNAIEAVRKFMQSADRAVPSLGPSPTRRQALVDSALEMSERLVEVEYDFIRGVVHSTGRTVGGADGGK
jgi:hypothetical protein